MISKMPANQGYRLHAMDSVRSFCMLLGIVLHTFVSYAHHCPPHWVTPDLYRHVSFDCVIFMIHFFRMEVFFVMSGFFANLSYEKKGAYGFIKNRLQRILLPFVTTWVLLLIFLPFYVRSPVVQAPIDYVPLFHLWFFYYLLFLYSAFIVLKLLGRYIKVGVNSVDSFFERILKSPFHLGILAAITLPMLFFMKTTMVDTPLGFSPSLQLLAYYGIFFSLGWIMSRQSHLWTRIAENYWLYFWIALITSLLLVPALVEIGRYFTTFNWQLVVIRALYALCTWALVFFVIGFFLRYFNRENKIIRYLADSSYWLYIAHLPLVWYFQSHYYGTIIGPLKPLLVFCSTLIVLLISYHYCVRYTMIGKFLNGPRFRT